MGSIASTMVNFLLPTSIQFLTGAEAHGKKQQVETPQYQAPHSTQIELATSKLVATELLGSMLPQYMALSVSQFC